MTKREFWENREAEFGILLEINKEVRETPDGKINVRIFTSKASMKQVLEIYKTWGIENELFEDDNISYILVKK